MVITLRNGCYEQPKKFTNWIMSIKTIPSQKKQLKKKKPQKAISEEKISGYLQLKETKKTNISHLHFLPRQASSLTGAFCQPKSVRNIAGGPYSLNFDLLIWAAAK